MNALHLSKTAEWGTPPEMLAVARALLGGTIDLDPCSSAEWNKTVGAKWILTKEDDALSKEWHTQPDGEWVRSVFVNPPGDRSGTLPRAFYKRLIHHVEHTVQGAGVFLGFNLNHLAFLDDFWPVYIPKKRPRFIRPDGTPGKQPTHFAFLQAIGECERIETPEGWNRWGTIE